jgi:RNA polymerase sigma-70 factor (ECF subfamily)
MSHADRPPGDEELAARAQAGCIASFEELVRRYQAPALQFLRRLGAGADAEDLLQETFLRAYRGLDQYRQPGRFITWLFTIARRVQINHFRRSLPGPGSEGLASAPARGPGPPEIVAENEQRQRLWNMAARILSDDERTAVWLYYVEGMSTKEISAVLERSWVSVKTMLFRARRRLLALLPECEKASGALEPRPGPNALARNSRSAEVPYA